MTERSFSDDDLMLYLDGEASGDLSQRIELAMGTDASLSVYLDRLSSAQNTFMTTQEDMLSLAPPLPDLPHTTGTIPAWSFGLMGLAAGLVLATSITWAVLDRPEPSWREVVANYQSLYVTETLAGAKASPKASAEKLADLSGVLGLDLTNLPEIEGLDYRRAQHLGYKGHPLAQLTYLTADGGPVALCIIHTGGESSGITVDVLEGMDAYSWVENGFGILLIGPPGDNTLPDAAKVFQNALRASDA